MKVEENTNKPSKNSLKKEWRKIKLKGNVISEDGGGLEGLIGLEVLEKYDKKFVSAERKSKNQLWKERQEEREATAILSGKKRKRKDSDSDGGVDSDEGGRKPKQQKKKKKNVKKGNRIPGQYVLAKPDLEEIEENDENLNESQGKTVDDLVHWNGLGIPETILRAIAENGFHSPTEIQSLTLPAAIMGKKDILGAAETGSGKTLAFGIPILAGIMELKRRDVSSGIRTQKHLQEKLPEEETERERENLTPPPEELSDYPEIVDEDDDDEDQSGSEKPLYALVLTPTRELAVQVRDHLVAAAKYTGIKIVAIFGGMAAVKQERVLKRCPEVVVATPGRLWEMLCQGNSHLNKIDDVSFLVIDETDRMVEKGHFEELRLLLNRINVDDKKKERRQNFVFSATLTLVHDLPDHMQKKNMGRKNKLVKVTPGMKIQKLIEELGISQPKIVDITRSNQTAQTLTESRLICPLDQKDFYLYYFIQMHPGRTIVFCNSIDCVKRLSQLFSILNCKPLPLHANMIQKQRLKNLEKFRNNPTSLLIATDVAARGLDIANVQHVIHYQVPRTSENYVHRSGRTARANNDGITVIIMEPGEVKNYLKLCRTLDRSEDLPLFPVTEKILNAVKERVSLAREVDLLELKLRRSQNNSHWLQKNAEEMEILLHSDDDNESIASEEDAYTTERTKQKRLLATRRQQLAALLNRPIFPKGFSYKYPTSTGKLQMPFIESGRKSTGNSAVDAMKEAIQDIKDAKKQKNKNPSKKITE